MPLVNVATEAAPVNGAASPFLLKASGGGPSHDMAEVRRALAVLLDPQQWVDITWAPAWSGKAFSGADIDGVCEHVRGLASAKGVYWSLNACRPGLEHNLRVRDVVGRRWLMLDCDPARPEDSNATEAEHEAAREAAFGVTDWLTEEHDWPSPVIIDSGNGWQACYRIDLPATEHARTLLKMFLLAVGARFDSAAVTIDKGVFAANTHAKLPGTWVRKGPATADRPHRIARLVHVPQQVLAVPAGMIAAVAGTDYRENDSAPPGARLAPWRLRATAAGKAAYAAAAIDRECAMVAVCPPGGRNTQLNKSGFRLGQLVGSQIADEAVVVARLVAAAVDSGLGRHEAESVVVRSVEAGKAEPRFAAQQPRPTPNQAPGPPPPPGPDGAPAAVDSIIVRASQIQPKPVEWLWQGRIPLGKLTTFAGVGGLGKTFVLCDITARVTRGDPWPDSSGECCEPGQVLFVSGEDDADDTLVPRLMELGADLERVAFLKTEALNQFTLADLETLDRAIDQINASGPPVRFVAIDPPTAYLGDIDDHKNAELRSLLSPLAAWAGERRVAVVFNTHINKGSGQKVDAMMRVMGSVAWVFAVRAAHLFARDPEDPERRLFVGMKMNIGRERKGLAYKIAATSNDLARVEWLGEVETTANEAINNASKPRRVVASEWLIEKFSEQLEWRSDDLFRAAAESGISKNAIYEAKDKLQLPRARRVVTGNGDVHFVWWVPEAWHLLQRPGPTIHQDSGTVGRVDDDDDCESF